MYLCGMSADVFVWTFCWCICAGLSAGVIVWTFLLMYLCGFFCWCDFVDFSAHVFVLVLVSDRPQRARWSRVIATGTEWWVWLVLGDNRWCTVNADNFLLHLIFSVFSTSSGERRAEWARPLSSLNNCASAALSSDSNAFMYCKDINSDLTEYYINRTSYKTLQLYAIIDIVFHEEILRYGFCIGFDSENRNA